MNDFEIYKSHYPDAGTPGSNLHTALLDVERSNAQLEHAFRQLREKMDRGAKSVQKVGAIAKIPATYAQHNPIRFMAGLFVGAVILDLLNDLLTD